MTAARLAWHGSGIWTTDDVDRGVTGSETGVSHVGGSDQVRRNDGEIVRPHGEYCRPRILRKSLFALKQTSRRKSSSAAILSLSSYFLSATSIGFFFLRSVSSIRFLSSFALIITMNIQVLDEFLCSRRIGRQSGDFIARAMDALFKIKAPTKPGPPQKNSCRLHRLNDIMTFFQHCTRENRSINNVLTDVFMAKDTSAAQDKTSDKSEDLKNRITDVAQQHIPVLISLTINDIFILACSDHFKNTLRPQAMVRTILSHQRDVYRTEYRYELSDVNHLSQTSSEEREADTKKTLTIDPVDESRSTIASPSDQMAQSEILIRDSLENNDVLRKASKSIIEIRSSCAKPKGSKAKEFGIVSLPHVVLEDEEAPAVGGSPRKSGGRPSISASAPKMERACLSVPDSVAPMVKKNWTDTSAMGGHRLINDLTKAGSD
ncbi:hypothetical protein G5I_14216 [Acromyrmex echinatior]|uniref:Uncharacterized protein n=1 Tax=Acromyrmex echinatior TaxID=103372 RepID=F4X778_ACREC|nr:hypothetical protein G5I_14216 [Acromyrmex echinatior]